MECKRHRSRRREFIRDQHKKNVVGYVTYLFTVFPSFNFEFHCTVCFSKQTLDPFETDVGASVEFTYQFTHNAAASATCVTA